MNGDGVGGVRGCHPQVCVTRALLVAVRVAAAAATIAATIVIFTVAYFSPR